MLKVMRLRRRVDLLRNEETQLHTRQASFSAREAELATQIQQANTEEELNAASAAVAELEAQQKSTKDRLEAIQSEVNALLEEIEETEDAAAQAAAAGGDGDASNSRSATAPTLHRSWTGAEFQRRCADFQRSGKARYSFTELMDMRAAVLSSSKGVAGPTKLQTEINDPLGVITPSLIDMMPSPDCTGLSEYSVPYVDTLPTAAIGADGTAAKESAPTFGLVTMKPTLVNVVAYVSKHIRKMTPVQYEAAVTRALRGAVRQTMSDLLIEKLSKSTLLDTITLTAADGASLFDDKLLRKIIIAYGGNQAIVGAAVLSLNKLDLEAFASVSGKNEFLPAYKITPDTSNPNTGIIGDSSGLSCRYSLNDKLPALCTATLTDASVVHMLYGSPLMGEMPKWGDVEVSVYDGEHASKGLLTIVADGFMDAAVTVPNGFLALAAKTSA